MAAELDVATAERFATLSRGSWLTVAMSLPGVGTLGHEVAATVMLEPATAHLEPTEVRAVIDAVLRVLGSSGVDIEAPLG